MKGTYLFVYGTLKRGQSSHRLLAGQELIAAARTLPRYRLYDNGRYPCLVADEVTGVAVQGEVWSVNDATLQRLDEWEGVPTLYRRQALAIEGFAEPVWGYVFQGDVADYRDCGDVWPWT